MFTVKYTATSKDKKDKFVVTGTRYVFGASTEAEAIQGVKLFFKRNPDFQNCNLEFEVLNERG